MSVSGRSQDSDWIMISAGNSASGWVQTEDVVVFNVDTLPVIEADAMQAEMPAEMQPQDEPDAEESVADAPAAEADAAQADAAGDDDTQTAGTEPVEPEPTAEILSEPAAESTSAADTAQAGPTPSATPRPAPQTEEGDITAEIALQGSRLNVRSGPGTSYTIVTKAYPDEIFIARGRNADSTWVQIEVAEGETGLGWVAAQYVFISDPITDLPVTSDESDPGLLTPAEEESDTTEATSAPAAVSGLSGNIVFQTKGSGEIYVYNLDSGNLRLLTGGYEPEVSKDGREVVFTRYGERPGIYSINIDGSNERYLFGERELLASPKWSPDSQWIVFSRAAEGYECYDFGFGICITEREVCPGFGCLPSERRELRPEFELSRIDRNGDEYRDLNSLTSARAPDWNGAGILYDASTGLELTKDEPDVVTSKIVAGRYYQDADWAPDGGRIVFQVREGDHYEIFGINADGSGLASLTRPVTTLVKNLPSNVSPAWSPDGRHIVYLSSRDSGNSRGDWRVWIMNSDGSNQRPLPLNVPIDYGFAHEQMVSWGPAT